MRLGTAKTLLSHAALMLITTSLATSGSFAAERAAVPVAPTVEQLQRILGELKTRLEIPAPVVVSIVPNNALMMSVEAPTEQGRPFQLAIDATFLAGLAEDEIEAAIAHELGHVWVFTHHPFLQTEELANQIAMRAVSRNALERLYQKVWKHGGTKGDLARFLGPDPKNASEPKAGLAPQD